MFKKYRDAGGHEAQRERGLPHEDRRYLSQMRAEAMELWSEADKLVLAASEQVLRSSQVRQTARDPLGGEYTRLCCMSSAGCPTLDAAATSAPSSVVQASDMSSIQMLPAPRLLGGYASRQRSGGGGMRGFAGAAKGLGWRAGCVRDLRGRRRRCAAADEPL